MIISGFGIKLIRLRHEHIEFVREKRNSEKINQYMEFRDEITTEMQEKWFQSINNKFNNYFIIEFQGEQIGMIYGSSVNWELKETANGGIFIWDGKWLETKAPLAASLMLTELSFLLDLKKTFIKVLKDNPRAIAFNKNLGYSLLPGQESKYNQQYVLTEESYFEKAGKFRQPYVLEYTDVFQVLIEYPEDESEANIIAIHNQMNPQQKKRFNLIYA